MGAAAAAIIIRREKDLVVHFRRAGAVAPASARSAEELGVHPEFAWRILVDRAIIRQGASSGTYYLDEPSWEARGRMRRRMAVVMLAIVILFLFPLIFLKRR